MPPETPGEVFGAREGASSYPLYEDGADVRLAEKAKWCEIDRPANQLGMRTKIIKSSENGRNLCGNRTSPWPSSFQRH
jgi:hypothetical protein